MTCKTPRASPDESKTIREEVLAANRNSRLLQCLSTTRYDAMHAVTTTLVEIHNSSEIDILEHFQFDELDVAPPQWAHKVSELFRRTLGRINCAVADALATVRSVNTRLENGRVDGTAHYAFDEWLQASDGRPEQALQLVLRDTDTDRSILRAVLTAGGGG